MATTRVNGALLFFGMAFVLVGLAVADYKLKHPKCRGCGLALEAIDLAEKAVCPACGQVLSGLQALLA